MLLDPSAVAPLISWEDDEAPSVGRWPVYVDFTDSILDRDAVLSTTAASVVPRTSGRWGRLRRRLRGIAAPSGVTSANIGRLLDEIGVERSTASPIVLVVGGGEVGLGADRLYDDPGVGVIGFDIYASPSVQFVADAHRIPLADGVVDGVVVQAVLEHVLDPARVVDEIHRVLRPNGVVYAETPFLQHVHEGAYDFTRYTESGHRWLFRWFDRLDSGVVGGAGVQTIWTIGALAGGLFRSRSATRVVRLALFWLRYLDRLVPEPHQIDGAAGCTSSVSGRRPRFPRPPCPRPIEGRSNVNCWCR